MDTYTWTIDAESDFGGRTNETTGITKGLPRIFEAFRKEKVKALFFVSTELLEYTPSIVQKILSEGHEIGSHGHFHTIYKEDFRKEADRKLSLELLATHQSLSKESIQYRAPKFNFKVSGQLYSDRNGHVGLLKHMWLKTPILADPIFYLHPFDIVGGNNPPNLFCRLWYSKPDKALQLFKNLLQKYPGSQRL